MKESYNPKSPFKLQDTMFDPRNELDEKILFNLENLSEELSMTEA